MPSLGVVVECNCKIDVGQGLVQGWVSVGHLGLQLGGMGKCVHGEIM